VSFSRQLDFLVQLIVPRRKPEPAAIQPEKSVAGRDAALEEQARQLLRALGCDALASRIQVRWNPRMRSTAGTAFAAKSLITLNPRLRPFGAGEVDRTLRHELAHLLAHHRAGRRRIAPHGREWQQACCDLGLVNETRCHTLPLPRRQIRARHFYRCPSCAVEVRRVRPFGRKTACLACCHRHNRGRYHDRFRFVKIATPQA
jgi:predicted SprT family Zn-dependent metalloprotease